MEAEKARFPVAFMAERLGVSWSGFCSRLARGRPPDPWGALREEAGRAWIEPNGVFGARSVRAVVAARGAAATLYRVRKCMREQGMRGCHPRKHGRTTAPDPNAPSRPDPIRRDFSAPVPTTRLVGDITRLRTGQGWLHLSTVIDLPTRMVVGWSTPGRTTADLVTSAPESAKARGHVAGSAVFHGDRGSQHASRLVAEWAARNDVRLSVGRTGSCHDDAVAESFFASLKNEMYRRSSFATRSEARLAVVGHIERFYNRQGPHSAIGYQVPGLVMDAFMERMSRPVSPPANLVPALPLAA